MKKTEQIFAELVAVSSYMELMDAIDLEILEHFITWKQKPKIEEIGRTAFIKLQYPFKVNGVEIEYLKVKGLGFKDHQGEIKKPSSLPYRRTILHLAISANSQMYETTSGDAPMGAMTISRAIAEYSNAQQLLNKGVSTEVPLALYRYSEIPGFSSKSGMTTEPLAVVVAGLPCSFPHRGNKIVSFGCQKEEIKKQIDLWYDGNNPNWLMYLREMWQSYGIELKKFHLSGLYRHNANPGNFGLSNDSRIYFTDLDSSRSLVECGVKTKSLQVLRDVSGAFFHCANSILASSLATTLDLDTINRSKPLNGFIDAYFSNDDKQLINNANECFREQLESMWNDQAKYGLGDKMYGTLKNASSFQDFMASRDLARSRFIDRPSLFARTMLRLYDIYSHSEINEAYPLYISENDFRNMVASFFEGRE